VAVEILRADMSSPPATKRTKPTSNGGLRFGIMVLVSIVRTESFELGCYIAGDEESDKLALVLPGLLDTKDYSHMRSHTEFLAALGYYAISFDMPGTWESGNSIEEYSTTNSLRAVNELITRHNRPTLLVGHSNGGRLALLSSIRNSEVEACIAIMNAPTFVRASNYHDRKVTWKAEGTKTIFRDEPAHPGQQRRFDVPFSFCVDADKYDARIGLDGLKIPKLFIAGEHDTTVTPEDVRQSFEIAAEPKKMTTIDSDHNYRRHPNVISEVNQLIQKFLT
jgi:pimeloyl-ACP methyl ester carboxylesterase